MGVMPEVRGQCLGSEQKARKEQASGYVKALGLTVLHLPCQWDLRVSWTRTQERR
jgi:hypothetical protein